MIWNGKVYRNLEQQVEYLTEYLADQAELTELGIKVIGEAAQVSDIPPDDPDNPYEFGDAYLIGTEPPYTMYIWTRANGNHPEDFWFNVGRFPMPGPQGEPGIGVDNMTDLELKDWTDIESNVEGGTGINNISLTGKATMTMDDNTAEQVDLILKLPFYDDGQVKVQPHVDPGTGDVALYVYLNENLTQTYVHQKVGPADDRGYPYVYGANETYSSKIDSLVACPIKLIQYNLVLARGNNTTYSSDKYNTVLGKENVIGLQSRPAPSEPYACMENLVFGGKNTVNLGVQDAATFGYRNVAGANQAFTAGYKNENYGVESIVIGNQNFLDGTTSVDTTPDPDTGGYDGRTSTTKHMAVFGSKNSIQHTNLESLIAGYNNKVNNNGKWNFVVGANQNLGKHNACVNALDYGNTTGDYVEDSTMIGYGNHIYGGVSGSVVYAVNILGNNCSNRSNGTNFKKVSMIGEGLVASRDDQIILGKYNQTNPYDLLQVGNGTADDYRSNLFTVSNDPLDGPMMTLGNVSLTASEITALKALLQ